jgi:HSP20 family molecular chaperone IbpA
MYPIESRKHAQVSLEDDMFIKMIKKYYAIASPECNVDRELLIKQLSEHSKQDISQTVDPETLNRLLSLTSVDIMTVSLPTPDNGYVGVSIYCDDKGKSKNLPLNERATSLAIECGIVNQLFNGDVFISRMFDDGEDHWFRMNFGMSDVSSSAQWVKKSAAQMASKLGSGPRSLSGLADQFFAKQPGGSLAPTIVPPEDQPSLKGETESYKWYQTDDEVDITIRVPDCKNKKEISVSFKPRHVKATVLGTVFLDAELADSIVVDESTWTFSDDLLQITLSKKNTDKMWKSLLASQ